MAQIIDFATARAAVTKDPRAFAPQAVRKLATATGRTLTAAQRKRRDDVRAKAQAAL